MMVTKRERPEPELSPAEVEERAALEEEIDRLAREHETLANENLALRSALARAEVECDGEYERANDLLDQLEDAKADLRRESAEVNRLRLRLEARSLFEDERLRSTDGESVTVSRAELRRLEAELDVARAGRQAMLETMMDVARLVGADLALQSGDQVIEKVRDLRNRYHAECQRYSKALDENGDLRRRLRESNRRATETLKLRIAELERGATSALVHIVEGCEVDPQWKQKAEIALSSILRSES